MLFVPWVDRWSEDIFEAVGRAAGGGLDTGVDVDEIV
jgi:hypothetical protein